METLFLLIYLIVGAIVIGLILTVTRSLIIYLKDRSNGFLDILRIRLSSKKTVFITIFIGFLVFLTITTSSVFLLTKREKNQASRPPSQSIDELVKGKIGYDIPNEMIVGENYLGIATISKSRNDSILLLGLEDNEFVTEEIYVASRVRIVLLDPVAKENFEITALNTNEQLVDAYSNTIWKWNIIPKTRGDNNLILRATVKIIDEHGETYKDIEVFEKTIQVKSSIPKALKEFLYKNWHFLLSALILPFIGWLFKRKSSKKKKRNEVTGFKPNSENKKS